MINKSLSLLLGISLSLGGLATETLAYPNRVRFNPNAGVHRTIIAPNGRRGNNYPRNNSTFRERITIQRDQRGTPYYGGRGNSTYRERIRIDRNQRGTCYNCGYYNNNYSPRNYRGYGRNSRSIRNYSSYSDYR